MMKYIYYMYLNRGGVITVLILALIFYRVSC